MQGRRTYITAEGSAVKCRVQGCREQMPAPHNFGQSTIVVSGGGSAGLVPGQTVHSVQAVMLQKSAISLRRQSF